MYVLSPTFESIKKIIKTIKQTELSNSMMFCMIVTLDFIQLVSTRCRVQRILPSQTQT